jgi:ubiquinone/menaquinone biosynthesis C-methylase UbiE
LNREDIKAYFERISSVWAYWQDKNKFYHQKMHQLIQGMTPPGSAVLELGSGTGDLLTMLRPRYGVGLNIAQGLTDLARRKFPNLEFSWL